MKLVCDVRTALHGISAMVYFAIDAFGRYDGRLRQ